VAYLVSSNRCEWGDHSTNLWQVGRSIQSSDEITLYEGVAEFRLASGVSLSVEGPAALIVNSPTSLVVQYGKLAVQVPWEVSDFKVLASSCRMAAADAEFGVNVFGSDVDIHVFSGEVVASSSPFEDVLPAEWELGTEVDSSVLTEAHVPADAEFTKVRVPGGRGLKLSSREGRMRIWRWHPAEKSEFTNKLTMAGPLPVARPYVEAVLQSKPVGYWRFESLEGNCIPNEVSPSNALQVVGNVKLVGDEENRVVDFGRVGSNGHLVSSEPVDALSGGDYSVEVWVKSSHYHRGGVVGMVAHPHFTSAVVEPANAQAFSVELTGALYSLALKVQGLSDGERNRIRFLHRDPPGSDYFTGHSCFSGDSYQPRNWQQVVAVKKGSRMWLYVDGRMSAAAEDSSRLTTGLYLEVGQLIGVANILPFVGQLDELSIYNRALNEKEIVKHFQMIGADPNSPRTEPGA
ncbi:MAG: LamG domain-containing protein, partial [Pirellulales bacterium]